MSTSWDREYDVVIVGSGGGALCGAYVAGLRGAETIVVEKTNLLGGTTAYSGGGLWMPGNQVQHRYDVPDTIELGRLYIQSTVGDRTPVELRDSYLETGPELIALLEENEHLPFQCMPIPDYFDVPGRLPGGRHIKPADLKGEELGPLLDLIRPRVAVERLGSRDRREHLIQGQALIGRLLLAITGTGNVTLARNTAMQRLVMEGDRVVGIEVESEGKTERIGARGGVLLAAGGFEQNDAMRRKYQDFHTDWSMGVPSNVGDAIVAATEVGADVDLMDQAWWCSSLLFPDGRAAFFYGVRGGGIMVNSEGERFANESMSYERLGRAMREGGTEEVPNYPAYWILDSRFDEIPTLACMPIDRDEFIRSGIWKTDDTLEGLARQLNIPPDALVNSVEKFNRYVPTGIDEEFHRGEDEFDLFFGDGTAGPNPCLVPIDQPPFLAVTVVPGDLGTKGGLRTDAIARVLRKDDSVIAGLYAAGNSMASITGNTYPGPGVPIGTSMVFSYLSVLDMLKTIQSRV